MIEEGVARIIFQTGALSVLQHREAPPDTYSKNSALLPGRAAPVTVQLLEKMVPPA